jgi:hypothetical protein
MRADIEPVALLISPAIATGRQTHGKIKIMDKIIAGEI